MVKMVDASVDTRGLGGDDPTTVPELPAIQAKVGLRRWRGGKEERRGRAEERREEKRANCTKEESQRERERERERD